jgi:hypothetical protein
LVSRYGDRNLAKSGAERPVRGPSICGAVFGRGIAYDGGRLADDRRHNGETHD